MNKKKTGETLAMTGRSRRADFEGFDNKKKAEAVAVVEVANNKLLCSWIIAITFASLY